MLSLEFDYFKIFLYDCILFFICLPCSSFVGLCLTIISLREKQAGNDWVSEALKNKEQFIMLKSSIVVSVEDRFHVS